MGLLCGIDEAGRGCIAGDLVVAGCILHKSVEGLNDSKKISEKKRYILFEQILLHSKNHIVVFSPSEVDEKGISKCMNLALNEIKSKLKTDKYIFDGNTNFCVAGLETIIKADAKVTEVSAASILAKVTHDLNIIRDSKKYPEYGFQKHKGYGTAFHIEMIKKYGYSPVHRKSFRVKALEKTLF